jgi:hypothetical protein
MDLKLLRAQSIAVVQPMIKDEHSTISFFIDWIVPFVILAVILSGLHWAFTANQRKILTHLP